MGGPNPGQGGNPGLASVAGSSNLFDPNTKPIFTIDHRFYNKKSFGR